MTKDMEAAREAVRELDETHNLLLHLGKTVVDTLERRIAAALAKVREDALKSADRRINALHVRDGGDGFGYIKKLDAQTAIRALAKEE